MGCASRFMLGDRSGIVPRSRGRLPAPAGTRGRTHKWADGIAIDPLAVAPVHAVRPTSAQHSPSLSSITPAAGDPLAPAVRVRRTTFGDALRQGPTYATALISTRMPRSWAPTAVRLGNGAWKNSL